MLRRCVMLVSLLALTACGPSKSVKEMESPNSVLVYGFITDDDSGRPSDFTWIQLAEKTRGGTSYVRIRTDEKGLFYGENLPLAQYQVHRFAWGGAPIGSGAAMGSSVSIYSLGDEKNPTVLQAKTPGLKYAGSFGYGLVKTGFFSQPKFSFKRVSTPTEKEVLQKLLRYVKGTKWEDQVKNRMAELN